MPDVVDKALRVLNQFDSYKKISLALLTGIAALLLFFGWRVTTEIQISDFWNNRPKVIRTELPCNLMQVRHNSYMLYIPFNSPPNAFEKVNAYFSAYTMDKEPDAKVFRLLCNSLIEEIYSNRAETILQPFKKRVEVEPDYEDLKTPK